MSKVFTSKSEYQIYVGIVKRYCARVTHQSGLLSHLTNDTLFGCLARCRQSLPAGRVCPCRLLFASEHQQFVALIQVECDVGSAGVEVILKTTVVAFLAFLILFFKVFSATDRTITDFG